MRFWIFNHYADPADGLATRSFDIARRLVERGHPTTIFVSNFSHYTFRPQRSIGGFRLWRSEVIDGVRFVWIRCPGYRGNDLRRVLNMLAYTVGALLAAGLLRERPDVVLGVSVHPLAALAGWMVAKLRGGCFLFEVTDLWPETLIQFGMIRRQGLAARAMLRLERFLFQRAERIVMLWRHTDAYVADKGVDPAKILWVPHGVELERYSDLPPYDGAPIRPFRVLFLGGFAAANSIGTIVEAAEVLQRRERDDISLLLQGSGQEKDEIVRRARQLGLRNVKFPPPVPKARIAEAMAAADAFIYGLQDLPLYQFGISLNKLTDYLAGARPIIFFGRSSYDPVRDARAGISVPPGDPEGLASAIEQLADLTPQERVAMGCRGRQYLVENHNIPVLAERLLEAVGA